MQESVTNFSQVGSAARRGEGGLRFDAAVFDCDGLLVDTGDLWWDAYEACVRSLGGSLEGIDAAGLLGASVSSAAQLLSEHLGREVPEPCLGAILTELVESRAIFAMPGAAPLLSEIVARVPVAVATNAPASVAEAALTRAGLRGLVGPVVSAETTTAPKPGPEVYLGACRRLGVPPDRAVAFEDSAVGATAARAAGMTVIGVAASTDRLEADLLVPRLDDHAIFVALGLPERAARPGPGGETGLASGI
jgi:HAD superfamily hydrolase (TIGR01509 family)